MNANVTSNNIINAKYVLIFAYVKLSDANSPLPYFRSWTADWRGFADAENGKIIYM
jgi:hypothetical protein